MTVVQRPVAAHHNGRVDAVEQHEPHLDVAGWLIAHEVSAAGDALAEPEAAERACRKLLERLGKLITPRGCQALLARALYLTRADYTFLQGIEPGSTAETYIDGLPGCADGIAPDQVHRGLVALLGTLIGLVALFIGEHLMARLLLEVWSDAPLLKAPLPNARL
jgi:hypothetical protein